jgi:4-amino-4-deoxy-L-arabinose transferase-like glycosyltransferase
VATVLRPDDRTLQLVIPLVVLLNPAFADLMTAVNNDVLLNFALAAALLGAVLLIRDGPSPVGLLLLLLACGVALATKRTAFAALPPLALALLWSIWRRRVDLRLLLLLAALVVGAAAVSLQPVAVDASTSTYLVFAPRAWLDGLDKTYLRLDLDAWFRSVSDASLIGQRYQLLAMVGFSSFWARLSWGNVALPPLWEWLFLGLALGSLIGLAGGLWRERRKMPLWQRRCIWLFLITVGVACLALVARLHPLPPIEQQIYVPRGRYLFWAMVPVICLICLGVQWFLPLRLRSRSLWILLACFAVTDCVAIGTLAYAFQR